MPSPTFIGIGAEKSGTTWMASLLNQHPEIQIAPEKEVHFFDLERKFSKGRVWYESRFETNKKAVAFGDVTPEYLIKSETVAPRIKDLYPSIKLIAILRNPIDRAISNYHMNTIYGRIDRPIDQVLTRESHLIQKGRYKSLLKPFLDQFASEQVLILNYDDLLVDGERIIRKVEEHIGVVPFNGYKNLNTRIFKARYVRSLMRVRIFKNTLRVFEKLGFGNLLERRKHGLRRLMKKWNSSERETMVLDPERRRSLLSYYEEDIAFLEGLWKIDLSHWRK